jgi:hypothetical protein
MNGEVQLIVRSAQLSTTVSSTDALAASIVSGDSFCFGGSGLEAIYVIGSKIEIVDQNVSPEVVLFTRYVIAYDTVTGEITVDQPFTSNVSDAGVSIYTYTLIVADTYLDLYENESISQNWKFQDLSNFTAQGAFSREFRLPFSETNKEALGALFDNNVEQGAENYFFYKLPAEIRVDTLPIATGYLRVRKVYKQMGKLHEVEVAFYAETPDLVRTIGEKKLSDIAALADLNEVANYANVTVETADRIWALCDRGQKWANDNSAGSRPILDSSNPVYAGELTPAVSWWFLLRNIVTEAGFELVAGSLENLLSEYWMPFCITPQLNSVGQINDYFFLAYNSSDINSSASPISVFVDYNNLTEVFDNSGNFTPSTGIYTAPIYGIYTFNALFRFQASSYSVGNGYTRVRIYIEVNGTIQSLVAESSLFITVGFVTFTADFPLNPGDTVSFYYQATIYQKIGGSYYINGSANLSLTAGNGTTNGNDTFIQLINVTELSGHTINYPANAPDMRQIDFVNDVVKMHNCAIIPSRTVPNRIAIIPQDSYLGTGDVIDWTSKLDISKDVMTSSTVDLQKAKFQFTYTAGEDVYSKLYVDANRVYGDFLAEGYTINPSTNPSDFAIGDQKITLVTRSAPAAVIPGTAVPIQCFYNEQLEFVAPGPRCLYNAGVANINLYNEATSSATPTTTVPILNHYSDATFPSVDDYDLNWAPEVPPHVVTVNANPYNNLFNLYWRNYMNELYSPEARIMEAFFALDLKDILTFSFADKIWIQDSYWRILEITDYKVGYNDSTKVKLIKFLDQIDDCSSTPVGVTTNGEVEFESGGDAVEPTEDCCSRYGYFWDEINGICWAFNNGGQFRNSIIANPNPLTSASNSVVSGVKVSIENGNSNMLAVGQDLNLTKFVNGSNLLGKNVETNLPGLHIGGGYRNGNPANTETGWSQSGIAHFHVKDSFASAGASHELLIEGLAGEHLEIPDSTTMSCILNLTIQDETQTDIDVAILSFGLTKVGGVAYATAVTVISNDTFGTGYTYAIDIDTTTNTDEHRIVLTINAAPSFPITLISTASLHYQQNKLT